MCCALREATLGLSVGHQSSFLSPTRCLRTKLLHLSRHGRNLHDMLHFLNVSVWHLLAFKRVGPVLVLIDSVLSYFSWSTWNTRVHCSQRKQALHAACKADPTGSSASSPHFPTHIRCLPGPRSCCIAHPPSHTWSLVWMPVKTTSFSSVSKRLCLRLWVCAAGLAHRSEDLAHGLFQVRFRQPRSAPSSVSPTAT